MKAAHRRDDISDKVWNLLEPHLPGRKGSWGGLAKDNRRFINAVFGYLRRGAPCRDLPPDFEWIMIDSTHVKAHLDAAGAKAGNQAMAVTKGGSIVRYTSQWMRMVCH